MPDPILEAQWAPPSHCLPSWCAGHGIRGSECPFGQFRSLSTYFPSQLFFLKYFASPHWQSRRHKKVLDLGKMQLNNQNISVLSALLPFWIQNTALCQVVRIKLIHLKPGHPVRRTKITEDKAHSLRKSPTWIASASGKPIHRFKDCRKKWKRRQLERNSPYCLLLKQVLYLLCLKPS